MSPIDNNRHKIVAVWAIEHTLLQMGKGVLEKVQDNIHKEYKCNLADCYEHPEYLNKVLKDLYKTSHHEILGSIRNHLDDFTHQRPISEFLDKIR